MLPRRHAPSDTCRWYFCTGREYPAGRSCWQDGTHRPRHNLVPNTFATHRKWTFDSRFKTPSLGLLGLESFATLAVAKFHQRGSSIWSRGCDDRGWGGGSRSGGQSGTLGNIAELLNNGASVEIPPFLATYMAETLIVRTVDWRSNGSMGVLAKPVKMQRNMSAISLQVCSEQLPVDSICPHCAKGCGRFASCVVGFGPDGEPHFKGDCANCHWGGDDPLDDRFLIDINVDVDTTSMTTSLAMNSQCSGIGQLMRLQLLT